MRTAQKVTTPCCGRDILVTSRPSRIKARPRNHQCPGCGTRYRVVMAGFAERSRAGVYAITEAGRAVLARGGSCRTHQSGGPMRAVEPAGGHVRARAGAGRRVYRSNGRAA